MLEILIFIIDRRHSCTLPNFISDDTKTSLLEFMLRILIKISGFYQRNFVSLTFKTLHFVSGCFQKFISDVCCREHLGESNELKLILGIDVLSLKFLEGFDWNVGDQCVQLVG